MVALNDNPARKPKASSQRKVSAQSADRLSFMPDVYPENIGMPLANPAATQVPDGTTDYIWQGSQVVEERNSSNAPVRQYVWGTYPGAAALTGPSAQTGFRPENTGLGSLNVDECVQLTTLTTLGPQSLPAGAYYLLQDLLYRAVALTDSSGSVVEAYDTDAYGNTLIFTAPGAIAVLRQEPKSRLSTGVANRDFTDDDVQSSYGANEIIYCGYPDYGIVIMVIGTGLYDPETDLYYVRNRGYNPALGRWIQRDPIGYSGGINLYEYVSGRAVVGMDPSGLAASPSRTFPFTLPSIPPGALLWTPPLSGFQQLQRYQSAAGQEQRLIRALQQSIGLFRPGSAEWNSLNAQLARAEDGLSAILAEESAALDRPLPPLRRSSRGGRSSGTCLWPNFAAGGIDLGADTTLAITQRIADEALLEYADVALAFALLP